MNFNHYHQIEKRSPSRMSPVNTPYFEINDYGLFFPGYSVNQQSWCLLFTFKQLILSELIKEPITMEILYARALQVYYTHHLSLIEYPNFRYKLPPKPRYDLLVSSVIWLQKKGLVNFT